MVFVEIERVLNSLIVYRDRSTDFFKGIALFTPGGDLVYGIDPSKQDRWHTNLCATFQQMLGLLEPPHFLVPCYSATIDCFRDSKTNERRIFAEACPSVLRYSVLLNAIFNTPDLVWQVTPRSLELCDPVVLLNYRKQFPALWENHDLLLRYDKHVKQPDRLYRQSEPLRSQSHPDDRGYVLRLFVAGHSVVTERILQDVYRLLEQSIHHPYTLKVIDILKHPEQAESNQISATPTLVKVLPQPIRRIVGELNNLEKILMLFDSPELPSQLSDDRDSSET